jgi:DNA repair protein REV1
MIVSHGGGFLQYLGGKTNATHIIASNLTQSKRKEFEKYRIVKPGWVVDSVQAGKLLPWSNYKLIEDSRQKNLAFASAANVGDTPSRQDSKNPYREQSDASWYTAKDKPAETCSATNQSIEEMIDDDAVPDELDLPEGGPEIPFQPGESAAAATPYPRQELAVKDEIDFDSTVFPAAMLDLVDRNLVEPDLSSPKKRSLDLEPETASKKPKLSAEEYNEALLADTQIRRSTVANPGFLEQFYRESRLHHLSTWKSELKSEMQALADSKTASQKVKRRPPGARRYILHVDFDSFFAAVSLKKHPQYIDQPVAVAHGTGAGSEIASCNYHARSSGVKNGMWMKTALDLCPSLRVLPYDFPGYEEASRAFYEELLSLTGNATVQSVSIDEALVDITGPVLSATDSDGINKGEGAIEREQEQASNIATKIRERIKARTACEVSVGIGGNILLAKVALRKAKPAGQYHVLPEEALDFIAPLEIRDLPGFAYKTGGKLEALSIKFVRDVREATKEALTNALGPKTGIKLWEYARGIDRKEVGDVEVRRSVSAEINWGIRFTNSEQVDTFMESLCTELSKRLLKEGVKGHHLTLKVMKRASDAPMDTAKFLGHGSCDSYTKSVSLRIATNAVPVLSRESISMLKSLGISPGELRGLGVQMTKLEKIKNDVTGAEHSSQKLLHFKSDRFSSRPTEIPDDPIVDNTTTPTKPKDVPGRVRFGAEELNQLTPSRKPLNTMGTQFLLPTQVDTGVLDELPNDIRSKLVDAHTKAPEAGTKRDKPGGDGWQGPFAALPSATQLDPEVLKALPLDVQREIMDFYEVPSFDEKSVADSEPRDSSPSPTKNAKVKKDPTPKKRGRGRPRKNAAGTSTLAQSSFITSHFIRKPVDDRTSSDSEHHQHSKRKLPKSQPNPPADSPNAEEAPALDDAEAAAAESDLDPSYLAALPSPLRREVLLNHRLTHVRAKNAQLQQQRRAADAAAAAAAAASRRAAPTLRLPPRPPRPTFTRAGLASLPDLRAALAEWVREFRAEGPYREDAAALGRYLARVVGEEEGDMDKAVRCVRWLEWVVGEELGEGDAREEWRRAVDAVGVDVQEAVKRRGLGRVRL